MTLEFDNRVTLGTIAGFENISTESNNYNNPEKPHPYTKQDIYKLIRDLKRLIDPDYLKYLDKITTEHILNKKNPHRVSLAQLLTSILNELYKEWKLHDPINNTGSIDYFTKVLFQNIKIASIETTLLGKALDEIPSVRAVAELLKKHNNDLNAHEDLLKNIFMGEEIRNDPSMALDATVGLPSNYTVTRYSPMTFINSRGIIETAPINTEVIDYQFGEPMFSIWGDRTNLFKYSENFNNAIWVKTSSSMLSSTIKKDPTRSNVSNTLIETVTPTAKEHTLHQVVSLTTGKIYTVSCFIRASGRYCFGFSLGGQPDYSVRFNLYTKEIFINDTTDKSKVSGDLTEIGYGWFRCSMTFMSSVTSNVNIKLHTLDISDGDLVYQGNTISSTADIKYYWDELNGKYITLLNTDRPEGSDALGIDIFGAQLEEGNNMSPYIATTNVPVKREKTIISTTNINTWFNTLEGTVVVTFYKPYNVIDNENVCLYSIHKNPTDLSIVANLNIVTPRRINYRLYGASNVLSVNVTTNDDPVNNKKTTTISYGGTSVLYAETNTPPKTGKQTTVLNTNSNTFTLGSNRSGTAVLNGYVKSFTYYPNKAIIENLDFLVEVNHG